MRGVGIEHHRAAACVGRLARRTGGAGVGHPHGGAGAVGHLRAAARDHRRAHVRAADQTTVGTDRHDGLLELGHALVAILGALRQRLDDHGLHDRRDLGVGRHRRGQRQRLGQVATEHAHEVVAVERHHAGEELVQADGRGVDVGAGVRRIAHGLLGRHVLGRAEHRAGAREAAALTALVGDLGDAEVEQLDEVAAVGALHQEAVRGLEVTVDDAARVGSLERADDLQHQLARARPGEAPLATQHHREVLALEVLHREEHRAAGHRPEVDDVDDVLVRDHRCRARLLQEAIDVGLLAAELLLEHLERDLLPQGHVLGQIDRAHATVADHLQHAEAIVQHRPDEVFGTLPHAAGLVAHGGCSA
ncbi:MAG: hypothetical protein U0168_16415 [Nannocystaceae bacterium]